MPRRTCPMPTKTNCPVSRTMILAASAAQRRESSTVSVAWPRIRPSRGAVVSRFCERPIEEFSSSARPTKLGAGQCPITTSTACSGP